MLKEIILSSPSKNNYFIMPICLNYFCIINVSDGILEACFLEEHLKTTSEKPAYYEAKRPVLKVKPRPRNVPEAEVKTLWTVKKKKKKKRIL